MVSIVFKMGSLKAFVFVVAALLVINYVSAGISHGNCPPKNKVYNNKPTCFSDADCQKWGQVCCPNQFNTKSCVAPAPWQNRADDLGNKQKYTGGGGGGVYCEGVKCRPYEVCKPDPITKRLKCQRA